MRMLSAIVALLAIGNSAVPARGADLTTIDRTIAQEPVYQARPKYCLLVFGPESKTRAWLVLDGEVLYVDRNGNGSLTEEGERIEPRKADWAHDDPAAPRLFRHYFEVETIPDTEAKAKVDTLHIHFVGTSRHAPYENQCMIDIGGQVAAGVQFADQASAPILHFAGPLALRHFAPRHFVLGQEPRPLNIRDSVNWLRVCAGTPGLGSGGTFVYADQRHDDSRKKNQQVLAEIDFPCQGGRTKRLTAELIDSCCAPFTFDGPVRIPDDAVSGTAQVTVSFPDWKKERVPQATFEVPIVDALPAAKGP